MQIQTNLEKTPTKYHCIRICTNVYINIYMYFKLGWHNALIIHIMIDKKMRSIYHYLSMFFAVL